MFASSLLGIDLARVAIDGITFAGLYFVYYTYLVPAPGGVGLFEALMAGAECALAQFISQLVVTHIPFIPESLQSMRDQVGVDVTAAVILGAYNAYVVGGDAVMAFTVASVMSIAANIIGAYVEDAFYHPAIVGIEEAAAYSRRKADRLDAGEKKAERAEVEGNIVLAEAIRANAGDDLVLS